MMSILSLYYLTLQRMIVVHLGAGIARKSQWWRTLFPARPLIEAGKPPHFTSLQNDLTEWVNYDSF